MKNKSDFSKAKTADRSGEENILLGKGSVYIEGVKVLQKQERTSYFVTLIISLVLVILLFVILIIA